MDFCQWFIEHLITRQFRGGVGKGRVLERLEDCLAYYMFQQTHLGMSCRAILWAGISFKVRSSSSTAS